MQRCNIQYQPNDTTIAEIQGARQHGMTMSPNIKQHHHADTTGTPSECEHESAAGHVHQHSRARDKTGLVQKQPSRNELFSLVFNLDQYMYVILMSYARKCT